MTGYRKFTLGLLYIAGGIVLTGMAIVMQPEIVSSVGIAYVSLATGLGVIVWGNIAEHKAASGAG